MHCFSGRHATVRVGEVTNVGLGCVFGDQHQSASERLCLDSTKTNNYITFNSRLTIRGSQSGIFLCSSNPGPAGMKRNGSTTSYLLLLFCVVSSAVGKSTK